MTQYVHFLHIVIWPWKLLLNHVIFVGCDQACSAFPSNKEPRSPERVELFCLFVACSYKSMETTALPSSFSWIMYCMPKVLRYNKLPISLERVEWFCWCFACSYVQLLDIHWGCKNMRFWAGNVRHELLANEIARYFKLKKLENYMSFHVDFLHVVR